MILLGQIGVEYGVKAIQLLGRFGMTMLNVVNLIVKILDMY
jgi:hypothetical protein